MNDSDHLVRLGRNGVFVALALLLIFGAWRYTGFVSEYNLGAVLRFGALIGFIALGMALVIMAGGIDLSVGAVAALTSVLAAKLSEHGIVVAVAVPVLVATGLGVINGLIITRLRIAPFVTTLAMLLAARGLALWVAGNESVSVAPESEALLHIGQGDWLFLPIPGVLMLLAYLVGWLVLERGVFGRHVLALGGQPEAARLLGVNVGGVQWRLYATSAACAGFAGVLLAAQYGAGQPTEGAGWELTAIASVVVGGTLLSGGAGTLTGTLAGVMLLGLMLNALNFENGLGVFTLSAHWQSVFRGAFLLMVVLLQKRLQQRAT